MTITAKTIADSIARSGDRVTTLQLRYPRFVHAELMTHRVFSRNASSSRAVPVERLIKDVLEDTAMPIHWGKNQKGMQADEEHSAPVVIGFSSDDYVYGTPEQAWLAARDNAISMARVFSDAGYHKQVVNRLLEPFSHINVIVTATEWENFFELRDHPAAQPEIRALAKAMRGAMAGSEPVETRTGQWHLPYLPLQDRIGRSLLEQIQVSAARCARVSYWTHDGRPTDPNEDVKLAIELWDSGHFSPFEHQARPMAGRHANFVGWQQCRHALIEG